MGQYPVGGQAVAAELSGYAGKFRSMRSGHAHRFCFRWICCTLPRHVTVGSHHDRAVSKTVRGEW
jgi:hypothetical protein